MWANMENFNSIQAKASTDTKPVLAYKVSPAILLHIFSSHTLKSWLSKSPFSVAISLTVVLSMFLTSSLVKKLVALEQSGVQILN